MTETHRTTRSPAGPGRWSRRAPILLAALLLVTCVSVEPSGWNADHGPVLPHDTFPADCTLCHLPGSWDRIRADFAYDHAKQTGVALVGAHAGAACLRCHNDRGPVQQFAKRGCVGCHGDTHRGKLGRECRDCHDESTWRPRDQVARHLRTRFPLVGAHAAAACYRCHPGAQVGNFEGATTDCATCHRADLARATSLDHVTSGFTASCERCHTPLDWRRARFAHSPGFPLRGAHAAARCSDCHTGPGYAGLQTACASCHLREHIGSANPNHRAAGLGTDCERCHGDGGWAPARYTHPPSFALTGAHRGRRCNDCHQGQRYAGLPGRCHDCHAAAYDATTEPNHKAAQIPTNCEACHSTAAWRPATFNHRFPRTGPHSVGCNDCHTTPANYNLFSCTHCHDHNQTEMDRQHRGVSGYQWLSSACLGCHPQGRER